MELSQLRTEMNQGFRELRDLIEDRRKQDSDAHGALDARLRVTEAGYKVSAVIGTAGLGFSLAILNHIL